MMTVLWRGARVLAGLGPVLQSDCNRRKYAGLCGDASAVTMAVTEALEGKAAGGGGGHSTEHEVIVAPEV